VAERTNKPIQAEHRAFNAKKPKDVERKAMRGVRLNELSGGAITLSHSFGAQVRSQIRHVAESDCLAIDNVSA
jgi:hypothetical protein